MYGRVSSLQKIFIDISKPHLSAALLFNRILSPHAMACGTSINGIM